MPHFQEEKQQKKLDALKLQEEEDLARILSKKYGVRYVDLTKEPVSADALYIIPKKKAEEAEVATFRKVANEVHLAARAPQSEQTTAIINDLKKRDFRIVMYMVSKQSLLHAWERYADLIFASEAKAGILDISGKKIKEIIDSIKSIEDTRRLIEEVQQMKRIYRISQILETVMGGAFAGRASDVHIEPEETDVRMRYRIDGVLTDVCRFDNETYQLLLSRIKLLSGLKLNIGHAAQDGRYSIKLEGQDIEIRTSVIPGGYGDSIVMRILDPRTIGHTMEDLGIEPELFHIFEEEIRRPNGIILTTGPTGSGKTTTLYAFIKKIYHPDIKIITIEDPIEYHMAGIVQTQIDKKSYSFAAGLRSILRQDPDVILVGEIRDPEVAKTAINASLTGHLVFSTLHTNDAAGAFPRLVELGVDPKVMGSAVNIIIGQRLVRQLKPEKRREVKLEGKWREIFDKALDSIVDKSKIPANQDVYYEPVEEGEKASECYHGRVGIFEAIRMDGEIETLVRANSGRREIAELAAKRNILSMGQDGIIKVLQGRTSLSELARVVDLEHPLAGQ